MRIVLIGGPLDGRDKEVHSNPPAAAWVNEDMRFFRSARKGCILYRAHGQSMEKERARAYLYAENTHAVCCDSLHRVENEKSTCSLCGKPLRKHPATH